MSRAVYIGDFGNGALVANSVAEALGVYYEDVDPFTFSYAMDRPDVIRRAVRGADTVTHSAGMVALRGMSPDRIQAFAAPIPTSRTTLVGRTVVKTLRMHTPGIGVHGFGDVPGVLRYDASATAEFAAHPLGNLGRLGEVAEFSSVDAAIAAHKEGIPTWLVRMTGDEYFQSRIADDERAVMAGVAVLNASGVHDELALRPAATLQHVNFAHWLS
jgi:hypothetical protein